MGKGFNKYLLGAFSLGTSVSLVTKTEPQSYRQGERTVISEATEQGWRAMQVWGHRKATLSRMGRGWGWVGQGAVLEEPSLRGEISREIHH